MRYIKKISTQDKILFPSLFETLNVLSPSPCLEDAIVIQFIEEMQQQNKCLFVMVEEDNVLGTVSVLVERKLTRGGGLCGHIEDVATHPAHQRKRIASTLIRYAITYSFLEKGCYKIILDCKDHLISLYQKEGFYIKGRQMEIRRNN